MSINLNIFSFSMYLISTLWKIIEQFILNIFYGFYLIMMNLNNFLDSVKETGEKNVSYHGSVIIKNIYNNTDRGILLTLLANAFYLSKTLKGGLVLIATFASVKHLNALSSTV